MNLNKYCQTNKKCVNHPEKVLQTANELLEY